MSPHVYSWLEELLRFRSWWKGINQFPDPHAFFGPGGLTEAEALCDEANSDLSAFIRPPRQIDVTGLTRESLVRKRDGTDIVDWTFDSPLPSGDPVNDRVQLRLVRHRDARLRGRCVIFHHPIFQDDWSVWMWFLRDLIREVPVAMMAGPHHFGRTGSARYAGEMSMNPNPARLFEAIRQWCWDHRASEFVLGDAVGLEPAGVVGYSFGAFQSLLLAAAGGLDVPIVSIACTNRYAFGLCNGSLGPGMIRAMATAGIDQDKLYRLTESLQLERHATRLRGRPVMYVRGLFDPVDPHPSLERLERALAPRRAMRLDAGHATLLFHRNRIVRDAIAFLRECRVLAPAARSPRLGPGRSQPAASEGRALHGRPSRTGLH